MVHDEMFENDDDKIENSEDASYWSKGRGKGQYKSPDRSIVCKRCGYPGHESHMCKLHWAKAQKHLSENPLKSGDVALSAFLCPDCGHPDCEGPDEDSDSTSEFFFWRSYVNAGTLSLWYDVFSYANWVRQFWGYLLRFCKVEWFALRRLALRYLLALLLCKADWSGCASETCNERTANTAEWSGFFNYINIIYRLHFPYHYDKVFSCLSISPVHKKQQREKKEWVSNPSKFKLGQMLPTPKTKAQHVGVLYQRSPLYDKHTDWLIIQEHGIWKVSRNAKIRFGQKEVYIVHRLTNKND